MTLVLKLIPEAPEVVALLRRAEATHFKVKQEQQFLPTLGVVLICGKGKSSEDIVSE